jgi:hypothetical protein
LRFGHLKCQQRTRARTRPLILPSFVLPQSCLSPAPRAILAYPHIIPIESPSSSSSVPHAERPPPAVRCPPPTSRRRSHFAAPPPSPSNHRSDLLHRSHSAAIPFPRQLLARGGRQQERRKKRGASRVGRVVRHHVPSHRLCGRWFRALVAAPTP